MDLFSQEIKDNSEPNKYLIFAERYKSAITKDTEDYEFVYFLKDKINDDVVYIYRFEPNRSKVFNLHNAHITIIIDGKNKLKGFSWINDKMTGKNNLDGKWVKFRENKTDHYLWVILAPDGSIMEFDRDIVWSLFRGGRVNELWLRDEWLGKRLSKK